LPGFPGATRLPHQKGNIPAWRLPDGSLAEWDFKRGELEVYDKTGKKHKGAYDPESGEKKLIVKFQEEEQVDHSITQICK